MLDFSLVQYHDFSLDVDTNPPIDRWIHRIALIVRYLHYWGLISGVPVDAVTQVGGSDTLDLCFSSDTLPFLARNISGNIVNKEARADELQEFPAFEFEGP